jgi:aminoglycoside phosphotransferase (APT) family kinase protein
MNPPGPLLASGRDSDIFEYAPGLVLRRSRNARPMHTEARIMEHARSHGYPVPAVEEISDDGLDLVLERIDGPSMVSAMTRRPWTLREQGAVLAGLHHQLHEIPGTDWLPAAPGAPGDRLIHLDLHPLNVMLSDKGPVVIDWPNARRDSGSTDVALTWVLIASGEIPTGRLRGAILGRARGWLINAFLATFDLNELKGHLRGVVEWKVQDPNMSPTEQAAMWRLASSLEGAT